MTLEWPMWGTRRCHVRIGRWILRPNAGWQLQEAPVMLPPDRFSQALMAAAERGVLAAGATVAAPGPEDS